MEGSRMDLRFTFLLLVLLSLLALFASPAQARNDYLNSDQHCSGAALEPYIEYSQNTNRGAGSNVNNGYDDDRATVGIRFRFPLQSTCTKRYRGIVTENAAIRQQLELLKMCGRYKGLELGPDFTELKQKCSQIWVSDELKKKQDIADENIKDKKIKELERKLKANENKNKTKD
jgi:hypothetical protein|tara:strand:- start:1246 stop:1767 length:522 start_codon:yes stop_codon:yes gene_type:complete